MTNPKDMLNSKNTKRTRSTGAFRKEVDKAPEKTEKSAEKAIEKPKKLSANIADYKDSVIKKTTVELPVEVLQEWKIDCVSRGIKQRDHLLSLLTRELNKRRQQ